MFLFRVIFLTEAFDMEMFDERLLWSQNPFDDPDFSTFTLLIIIHTIWPIYYEGSVL